MGIMGHINHQNIGISWAIIGLMRIMGCEQSVWWPSSQNYQLLNWSTDPFMNNKRTTMKIMHIRTSWKIMGFYGFTVVVMHIYWCIYIYICDKTSIISLSSLLLSTLITTTVWCFRFITKAQIWPRGIDEHHKVHTFSGGQLEISRIQI